MTPLRLRPAFFAVAALLLDCATLDKLPEGTCGNKVIDDAFEDCDGEPIAGRACGAPGSGATACRLLCGGTQADGTQDPACPDGWGCSVDHYCRAPTGQFGTAKGAVSSEVTSLRVGDFDHDGRRDLLATGPRGGDNGVRTKLLFFGAGGVLEQTTALAAPVVSPEVHDFDGDGYDDFSFGAGGFSIMRGQGDRSVVPVTFPSVRLANVDVAPVYIHATRNRVPWSLNDVDGSSGHFLFVGDSTVGTAIFSADRDSGGQLLQIPLPVKKAQLVGAPVAGAFLDADVTNTCGEVAVAMNTAAGGEIDIVSICRGKSWAQPQDVLAPVIQVKVGDPITQGVFFVDVDGDGNLDFFYGTAKGVYVVKGNGKKLGIAPGVAVSPANFPDVPLAAADLNGDGKPDMITPTGIVFSVPPLLDPDAGAGDAGSPSAGHGPAPPKDTFPILTNSYFAVPSARRTVWSVAAIADLNGDKFPDVVAGSAEVPDLDLIQVGLQDLTFSTIATSGPVSYLQLGDFDGDKILDVAFVESRLAANDFAVMYAYGSAFGPPETPRIVGRLPSIVGLQATSEGVPTNVDIFSRETDLANPLPTLAIAALLGSGDRQSLAPLLLVPQQKENLPSGDVARIWAPMEVHAGNFVDKSQVDILALATGYTFNSLGGLDTNNQPAAVWVAQGKGKLSFGSAINVADLSQFALVDPKTQVFQAPTVAADIDGDGLLEAISLAQLPGDKVPSVDIVRPSKTTPGKPLDLTSLLLPGPTSVTPRSTIDALDVDGDGHEDLVVVVTAGERGAPPSNPTRAFLLLNTGSGFDPSKVIEVVPPGTPDNGPSAFAMITTGGVGAAGDGAKTRKLAVVTEHRVFLATLRADRAALAYVELTGSFERGLVSGTAVASGDFDGDGVDDLAVADAGAVRILLQAGRLK